MNAKSDIIKSFEEADAILRGHFILSSGLHSDTYIQCALVMTDAARGERLCRELATIIKEWQTEFKLAPFDAIVAPAMGGVVVGYEMGRQLGMFCERVDGAFVLRRGFSLQKGQRILIVEDVVTTGKSTMETAACIESYGAIPVAVASLIDRAGNESNKDPSFTLPLISLLPVTASTYAADALPPELKAIPAVKPGSRFLAQKAS